VDAVLGVVNAIEPISAETMATLLDSWLPKASAAGITGSSDLVGVWCDRLGSCR
jgi:hypothetical protein